MLSLERRPLQSHAASRWPQRIPVGESSCALLHPSIPQKDAPQTLPPARHPSVPYSGGISVLEGFLLL